jgi:hypothetical protein
MYHEKQLAEMTDEERRERADMVLQAQSMIGDAIDLIENAVRGTEIEDHTDAYVIAHLKILASGDHGYLSRDTNLDDVIRQLSGREDEEDW